MSTTNHQAPRLGRKGAANRRTAVRRTAVRRTAWHLWGMGLAAAALLALGGCASSPSGPADGAHATPTPSPSGPADGAHATPGTTPTSGGATPTSGGGHPLLVYFSKHPDSDNNPLAVVAVNRVSPGQNVATYAIQQLIAGPTPSEASAGLYTELTAALTGPSNCGGADFQITLDRRGTTPELGTATLRFCRATSLPGDLSGGRIQAEIDRTLQQFSTIKRDIVLNSSGHCFNDLSGMDRCLSS